MNRQPDSDGYHSGSSLALTPLAALDVSPRLPGSLIQSTGVIYGPGRTLNEIYSALGATAEKHANRAAHNLGLGPAAVAERIRISFGDGGQRELALNELLHTVPRKLEKECGKLVHYALHCS
ncbi:hypothetical protein B0H17DRAFT_533494 [Mycena rosella]|uniref:Uncharacterized protein n=1 Tax=Mycena rosella TaxID=1033263 RepID=A0AAD7GKX3_MYCRO|nr:hypothetical protein B0H17DRAFT_533494 [Mycena rosella]